MSRKGNCVPEEGGGAVDCLYEIVFEINRRQKFRAFQKPCKEHFSSLVLSLSPRNLVLPLSALQPALILIGGSLSFLISLDISISSINNSTITGSGSSSKHLEMPSSILFYLD